MYHVGILVEDLDAAIERFADVLGVSFRPPRPARTVCVDRTTGHEGPSPVRYTYPIEGPPHYELIEPQPDGVWGCQHGEGIHHLGYWLPTPEETGRHLEHDHGMSEEASLYAEGRVLIARYLSPEPLHGVRLELVTEASRAPQERWLQTGELP